MWGYNWQVYYRTEIGVIIRCLLIIFIPFPWIHIFLSRGTSNSLHESNRVWSELFRNDFSNIRRKHRLMHLTTSNYSYAKDIKKIISDNLIFKVYGTFKFLGIGIFNKKFKMDTTWHKHQLTNKLSNVIAIVSWITIRHYVLLCIYSWINTRKLIACQL